MRGFIFEYYKYARYPKESMEDIRACLPYPEADKSILTYGEYDRVKINNVDKFDRFRDLSSLAKAWVGNRQSILLYGFSNEPEYVYSEEELAFKDVKANEADKHLFWALTEFPFRSELREKMEGYDGLLMEARGLLHQVIDRGYAESSEDCRYMALGVLGTFGIAVLWFSNQFTDILERVNKIKANSKYKGERMYLAAHTMFSRNPMYNNGDNGSGLIGQIKGYAYVQLTLKKWISGQLDAMKTEGKFKNMRHTSGEHDIAFEMLAKDAYLSFESKDGFNHDKDVYQGHILQTRVTFMREIEPYEWKVGLYKDGDSYSSVDNLIEVEEEYKDVRKLLRENLSKTSGLVDTLDSLHCDYRYNVASAVNQSWETDFSYIFLKNLECIKGMVQSESYQKVDFLAIFRIILNNLKQQVFHISEANGLNFELPKCHLRYTGQEDCILFGYMGIIKEILRVAYQLESCNKQSEIIPIVTVDVVPIIESDLYPDMSGYAAETEQDQDLKLLSLNLPHVAFYDIPMYIPFLYHEVYHYIVPKDREQRDYVMGIFLSIILFRDILYDNLTELFSDETGRVHAILGYLEPLLCELVIRNYSEVHKWITAPIKGTYKNESDKVLLIGKVYKDKVIRYFLDSEDFLRGWIREVNDKLCDGTFHGLSFDGLQALLTGGDGTVDISALKDWFSVGGERIFGQTDKSMCLDVLDKLMDGLEEVSADIPMIELTEMPLEEFLVLYAHSLKNELQDPGKIDNSDNLKELIRIGVVLDYYGQKGKGGLEEEKENFIYGYMARYINFSDETFPNIRDKVRKRREEAEEWFGYFLRCKNFYQEQFGLYNKLFREITELSGVEGRIHHYDMKEKSANYFQKYRDAYHNFAQAIRQVERLCNQGNETKTLQVCTEEEDVLREILFTENIRLIHYFQKQDKLTDLHDINQKHNKEKEECNAEYVYPEFPGIFKEGYEGKKIISQIVRVPAVYRLKEFLEVINSVSQHLEQGCQQLLGKKGSVLWYRGQRDSNFNLLPGIMRKNNLGRRDFNYLSQYQRYLFEEFKYRADGAPEVMDRSYYGISDYLGLMQHYQVSTNLMDWSEDAFTGLYFALEQLITKEKETADADAAIFVFSPYLYNDARRYMIDMAARLTPCTEPVYRASVKTAEGMDGLIPNIAASYNSKVYDMFLMGNLDYESENCYGYFREMALDGKEEMAFLPLAVHTSRLNPRIRSQSGIFVAYNLYAEPSSIMDAYSYMDLEKVQEYYFEKCEREDKEQFLYKVIIEKKAAKEIAECLVRMGISKERIYPELSNIGQRIH